MSVKVTVVGTGYVGLVTGVCLAHSGHEVSCIDIDPAKIALLQSGRAPIYEPQIEELLQEGLENGRLTFAVPESGWRELVGDVVFIAVGTPMSSTGAADLSQVRTVVEQITADADRPFTMVMKSTVPPGTGTSLRQRYLSSATVQIGYVSNPEFLREGMAVEDWYNTDRIVLGAESDDDLTLMRELYADIDVPVISTDIASAETIKYASNAFLSTKISFINEIANVCDLVDANIDAVAHGIGLDKRIGSDFLHAGIGYGGSCFPKDTRALDFISTLHGYDFTLLKAVIDVNNRQRQLPVTRLVNAFGDLSGRRIAVLGLAFKPGTDDVRESPALDMVPALSDAGATAVIYDPIAAPVSIEGSQRVDTVNEALQGASAAILVTEWPEFRRIDWQAAAELMTRDAVVLDGRNCLDPDAVTAAGLRYIAIGRPGSHRDR